MKFVLIFVGVLATAYAGAGVVQLFKALTQSNPSSSYGAAGLAANAVPVLIGALVALICFQRAFRKRPSA